MGLTLTPSADAATKFIDWRTAINGDADTSNAQIVDKAFGNLQKATEDAFKVCVKMPAYDSLGVVPGVPVVTTADGKATADSRGKLGSAAFKENTEFAGATHASSHKSDGLDPLSPDDIGAVSKKVPNVAGNLAALDISGNLVDSGKKIEQLQTKLTFDDTPTAGSSNSLTSGVIQKALALKQDVLTFDSTPTDNSTNPVTSGGVKKAIDGIDLTPYAKTTDLSSHIGDDTKHITAEERKVWNEKASVKMVNFMLISSGWVGTEAPYSQTVSVSGVTATSDGSVGIADSATDSQWNAAVSSQLRKTAQGADSITIKAYGDKPSLDLPCSITIMG